MPYADEDEQREYQRVWAAERRKKRQKLVRELLGDKCSKCGSNDRLHAHHVNRSDKEFSLLRGRGVSCSKGKWIREAEKCIATHSTMPTRHGSPIYVRWTGAKRSTLPVGFVARTITVFTEKAKIQVSLPLSSL